MCSCFVYIKSTINSWPCAKGMSSGKNSGGGMLCCLGEWSLVGSQFLLRAMAEARSQISFEMTLHSYGHAAPPKVSQRASSTMSSSGKWEQDWLAVVLCMWQHWYVDLKSVFVA